MNARDELLNLEKRVGSTIICARIGRLLTYSQPCQQFRYNIGEDRDAFLASLNFDYDNGYGCQELYGFIWFSDGTWAERGEYDGSEWWNRRKRPEMPEPGMGMINR